MSYIAVHNKLRKCLGSAENFKCKCGSVASQWAYNNSSMEELVDKIGRRYSRNFDDYSPMCSPCHAKMDRALITHCPQNHEYTEDNTIIDAGKRKCKTCVYGRNRSYKMSPEQKERKLELQRLRRRK